ncbi:Chromatin structure-remodeling complex subunit snf21 [Cyphellophora attinorum]|uniref:Chromatin structure-remodeling complex subunit snf21 n=1 Tax=Cyphellophora attinorum TaxID=1664694 RepID=A0A0N0NJF1_9EURO|nr:Chromatin structure-remodeling complex subunit snf21 [Phialophora attinorum]KPI36911.1 Chromatin structure-remodeling complex subunit snf21 [Phialophora attinorum]
MASVQSAPAMQAGLPPLPPNITNAQIQEVYQKFQRMKAQNVSETDPEFLKARNFLAAIQQRQKYQQAMNAQKMAMQQQAQQQQQHGQQPVQAPPQQPQSAPQTNGTSNGVTKNGVSAPQTDGNTTANAASPAAAPSAAGTAAQGGGPVQRAVAQNNGSFSPDQLNLLRSQIYAFKMLSKGLALPAKVQSQLFPSQKPAAEPPADATSAGAVSSKDGADATDTTETEIVLSKSHFDSAKSPYELMSKCISYADHSARAKRQRIPSLLPLGIDPEQVREEQERAIYNRVRARQAELSALPVNIASWDTRSSSAAADSDVLKLKALIEYKKLSLLQRQRELRRELQQELFSYDNLAMTANRAMHRRMKKQSLREAKITEKLEKQQRDARENKEKTRQSNHLKAILDHGADLRNSAMQQRSRSQKLGKLMINQHQFMEKEEQKRIERTAKQRLQALKANDEETYLKLLGQAKDSRISHLLKQTDGFLKQLAASVRQQQRKTAERWGDDQDVSEDEVDEESDAEDGPKVDYYAVAHRIKEEVNIQPSILVGGTLKEYQLKGLQWMISLFNNNLNGILADEMGLGKTIQTISLITYLIEKKGSAGPFLVIVPLSTLTNWTLEFEKWAPSVNKIVYKGPPASRKMHQNRIRQGGFQVLLTTYEYIIKDRPFSARFAGFT